MHVKYLISSLFFLVGGFSEVAGDTTYLDFNTKTTISQSVQHKGGIWIAYDGHGVFRFDTLTLTFRETNVGFITQAITDICLHKNSLFAANKFTGIYRLNEDANRWENITPWGLQRDSNFFTLEGSTDIILCGGANGLFKSSDNGNSWYKIFLGPNTKDVNSICRTDRGWFVGTDGSFMYHIDPETFEVKQLKVDVRGPTVFGFIKI